MKGLLIVLVLSLAASPLSAQTKRASCFHYGPDTVRIAGTLSRHMYYGAPGYGEDPKHDEKERGFYLDLTTPLCTVQGADAIEVAQTNVRRIQLVLDRRGYDALRPFLGKQVRLRGTLFGASTGHHHTPVLLDVIQPAHIEP
jgi:hypothetical protein